MAVLPKKTGTSKDMRDKQRLEQEHGELRRDGKDWTQSETDLLLDLYLARRGLRYIALHLQRPVKTIKNKIWKLATGYLKDRLYSPEKRENPNPTQAHLLNRREVKVLEMGLFGEGQHITKDRPTAVNAEHLARILNRPVAVIERYIAHKKPNTEGFLP